MLDDASRPTADGPRARTTDVVRCGPREQREARRSPRGRVDGQVDAAAALARRYGTVWNPEYGRPYTQIGREREAAWTSEEFTHIARIHCWYEDFFAELARDVLFVDTDAFTTAVFHEVYLGRPTSAFAELAARRYDLFVVCGLDVPWRHDGIREFDEQRRTMHERYVARATESGSPWVLVEGPLEARLATAGCGGRGGAPRGELEPRVASGLARRYEADTNLVHSRRQSRQRDR